MCSLKRIKNRAVSTALVTGTLATCGMANAASIISATDFYNPDFRVTPGSGASLGLELTVNTDPSITTTTQSTGNVSWTHQAGGLVSLSAVVAGVELAAYTETVGDSLVFGRYLDTQLPIIGGALDGILAQVVGASVLSSWQSTATVSNLNLLAGQTYEVSFDVAAGLGLPVSLLSNSSVTVAPSAGEGGALTGGGLLNLLDLVNLSGGDMDSGTIMITPSADITSLDFTFAASPLAEVSLLTGGAQDQPLLTFSSLNVADTIPEPSSALLLVLGGLAPIARRRRSR